jgi:hypothetical protein
METAEINKLIKREKKLREENIILKRLLRKSRREHRQDNAGWALRASLIDKNWEC